MPKSSLGCNCSGVICVTCFITDFDHRGCKYLVTTNETCGFDGSKWVDYDALADHVRVMFEANVEYEPEDFPVAFAAYTLEHIKFGKPCPFCGMTCIWRTDKLPHVSPVTGKLTFHAPDQVCRTSFVREF
jgi:hypothetical protein